MLDETTGTIHLLFMRNNTDAFRMSSSDDGTSWVSPTPVPKPGCAGCWIAPSFSAIQLKHGPHKGDLAACLDYSNEPGHQGGGPVERSGTLISSDHVASWEVGAKAILGDECAFFLHFYSHFPSMLLHFPLFGSNVPSISRSTRQLSGVPSQSWPMARSS